MPQTKTPNDIAKDLYLPLGVFAREVDEMTMEFDVLIVGGGVAGLAAAIALRKRALLDGNEDFSVCVIEKGAEFGAHILSGAVIETRALDELLGDWEALGIRLGVPAVADKVFILSKDGASVLPAPLIPKPMHNVGNRIVSLGLVVRDLARYAEEIGVMLFAGFGAAKVVHDFTGAVAGVMTDDKGRAKDGSQKPEFEPGYQLLAKYTLFAEGSRGHLGRYLIERFELDATCDPQHYAIGLKELWQVDATLHQEGTVWHGSGWPLSESGASGGWWLYFGQEGWVSLGIVIDLNYPNPYLSPFDELQRLKTHPQIAPILKGGKRLSYGARTLTKGGANALPKLVFGGGALIGCEAGFLNGTKIKGTHTAMKSGMLAADAVYDAIAQGRARDVLEDYERLYADSWLKQEMHQSRNFTGAMHKFGTWLGGAFLYVEHNLLAGKMPLTLRDTAPDYSALTQAKAAQPINYPKPDGVLTFDKMSSVYLSGTHHPEDSPSHLVLLDESIPIAKNLPQYAEPATRYCPAGVYEVVQDNADKARFVINAQNCIHCKTCDIKDPAQNIRWVCPQGASGVNYETM